MGQQNEEFRQMVIEKLRRGEDLPSEWARELFPPEKREYELVYHGKEREEDILSETMAVPLQKVRTFRNGKNGNGWTNMLIFGDNLQVLKTLLQMKDKGKLKNADGTPGVRLVYIDPPFATKQEFRGGQDQKAYQDKIAGARFLEFLRKRLIFLRELLSKDGGIYVHLDWKKGHYVKTLLDEIMDEQNFRNEIIVGRIRKNIRERERVKTLNYGHDVIYFYARSDFHSILPPTKLANREGRWHAFDAPGLRTGMDYSLFEHRPPRGRHWMFSKERAEEMIKARTLRKHPKTGKPQYFIEPTGEDLRDTIWDDVIASAFTTGYPTEKSEELLQLILEASSNPGDLVLDCFAGSGTTLAVTEKLGRRWIGVDCGKLAIYTMQKRFLNIAESKNLENPKKKYNKVCRPFTLYNAGLYDFSTLRRLPWADWRFFALKLFGCRDEPHTIGGLKLDGKLKGASVLVFNHQENPGKRIDEDTVQDIHAAIGKRVGRRFFIIAPRGVFAFQQDYIDLDDVRYYTLRIPYSIINELHRREFTALKQPSDENAVNDTVDAVGFDFIRPPNVSWSVGVKKRGGQPSEEAFLKVKGFESYARLRGEETRGGLESFAMLMFDFDFNGDVFDMDKVFYAHQLKEANWEARFPAKDIDKNVMAIFVDIHGNEAQEVIPRAKFGLPKSTVRKKRVKR